MWRNSILCFNSHASFAPSVSVGSWRKHLRVLSCGSDWARRYHREVFCLQFLGSRLRRIDSFCFRENQACFSVCCSFSVFWDEADILSVSQKLHNLFRLLIVRVLLFGKTLDPRNISRRLEGSFTPSSWCVSVRIRWQLVGSYISETFWETQRKSPNVNLLQRSTQRQNRNYLDITKPTVFQMDGVVNSDHTPYLIDLVNQGSIVIPDFDSPIPEIFIHPEQAWHDYVPGSEEAVFTLFGKKYPGAMHSEAWNPFLARI